MYITRPRAYVATHAVEMDGVRDYTPFSAQDEGDLAERMMEYEILNRKKKQEDAKPKKPHRRKYEISYETIQSLRTREKLIAIIGEGMNTLDIIAKSPVSETSTKAQLYQMFRNGWLNKVGGPGQGPAFWTVTPSGRMLPPVDGPINRAKQEREEKARRKAEMMERRRKLILAFCEDWTKTTEIAQKVGKHPGQVYRHLKNARDVGYLPKFKAKNPRVKGNVGSLKVEFHKLTPDIQKEWLSRAKGDDSIASVILDYAMDALYEEMAKK